MGTSLRNAGLVGTAPLAGSSVTGAAHGESFWARYGWLLAAVWVVFLVFPVRTIAESALGLAVQLLGYGLIALFATVYLSVFYRFSDQLGVSAGGHLRAWPFFVALLLIVTVSIPLLGSDAISFRPFLISFGAYLLSIRAMWVINVLILGISCAVALSAGVNDYVFLLGLLVVLIVVNAVNTALIRKNMAAENLRLDYAILAEQDRMARDVHDALGHSLTAVGLKAQLTERLLDTAPRGRQSRAPPHQHPDHGSHGFHPRHGWRVTPHHLGPGTHLGTRRPRRRRRDHGGARQRSDRRPRPFRRTVLDFARGRHQCAAACPRHDLLDQRRRAEHQYRGRRRFPHREPRGARHPWHARTCPPHRGTVRDH
ncbi:histidine kinase [Arthrobacter psychrolactophilus]